MRVLILDDDPSVCNLMHAALAPNGFKIDVVSDPTEMEGVLRGSPYHVVILDYVIPGLEPAGCSTGCASISPRPASSW